MEKEEKKSAAHYWPCTECPRFMQHVFSENEVICNCGKYTHDKDGKLISNKDYIKKDK